MSNRKASAPLIALASLVLTLLAAAPVSAGPHAARDGRAAGRLRRGIDLIQAGSRELPPEPARGLGQGHRMRAHQAHPLR